MKQALLGRRKIGVTDTVIMGIMIALNIILGRFTYSSPVIQIGLAFVVIFYAGMWYGPWWAAFIAGISDVLNVFLSGGAYFPEFTLSAIAGGLIYGLFLYGHKPSFLRTILAQLTVAILVNTIMNTAWIMMINHLSLNQVFWLRFWKEVFGTPFQIIILCFLTWFESINQTFERVTKREH